MAEMVRKKRHIVTRLQRPTSHPQSVGLGPTQVKRYTKAVPTSLIFISKCLFCYPICDWSLLCHSVYAQVCVLPPNSIDYQNPKNT
jgi:hypothetical protein